jgi:chromosome segregation ATPase
MPQDLHAMVAEYRAGLEAEIALLRQLDSLSQRENEASVGGDYSMLRRVHDARDAVMSHLVALEHDLKPLRAQLAAERHVLRRMTEFEPVAALHAEASEMVARIIASDKESIAALQEAEQARRAAASAMERGETTLQAYRRVIAPTAPNATLVNRRG